MIAREAETERIQKVRELKDLALVDKKMAEGRARSLEVQVKSLDKKAEWARKLEADVAQLKSKAEGMRIGLTDSRRQGYEAERVEAENVAKERLHAERVGLVAVEKERDEAREEAAHLKGKNLGLSERLGRAE